MMGRSKARLNKLMARRAIRAPYAICDAFPAGFASGIAVPLHAVISPAGSMAEQIVVPVRNEVN